MTYKVQYTRFFEEFGWEDVDTKEFDNLQEANDFYNNNLDDDNIQMWVIEADGNTYRLM